MKGDFFIMNEHLLKLSRIIIAVIVTALAWVFPEYRLILFGTAYLIAGYDVLLEAVEGIRELFYLLMYGVHDQFLLLKFHPNHLS